MTPIEPILGPDWEGARCAEIGGDIWYPERGDWTTETVEAIRICQHECPIAAQCLRYALDNNEEHGIWAGTTVNDRKRMRREAA